jgi:hypothetical protein
MLLCNNTAILAACIIVSNMSEADDVAQRYLALWMQYLTALLADPRVIETLKRWQAITEQFSHPVSGATNAPDAPFPGWPPFFAPFGLPVAPPSANGTGDGDRLAELSRRVDDLEHRLASLERPAKPRSTRRGAHTRGH